MLLCLSNVLTILFPFCFTENTTDKHVTVKFVQDTSKFWYKPDISREQGISTIHILAHPFTERLVRELILLELF